jgi:hypothetical protein
MNDLTLLNPIAGIATSGNPRPVVSLPLTGNLGGGGIGEGSFKRASSASYIGKDGLLHTVNGDRVQIIDVSAQMDYEDSYWGNQNITIDPGDTRVSGSVTAIRYNETVVDQQHRIRASAKASLTAGSRYILSIYLAQDDIVNRPKFRITIDGTADHRARYIWATDTFEDTVALDSYGSEILTNGIIRLYISWTQGNTEAVNIFGEIYKGTLNSYPGNVNQGIYFGPIQLEELPSDYEILEPSPFINSLAIPAVPRFTGDGLLLEGPGTNALLYSRNFDDAVWVKTQSPVLTKNQIGIDGVANSAWELEDNSTSQFEVIIQDITVPADANTATFSLYVKKDDDETRFPRFDFWHGADVDKLFIRLNTKTGAYDEEVGSGLIVQSVGDWWKLIMTSTNDGSQTTLRVRIYPAVVASAIDGPAHVIAVGSIVLDQAQVELNQAYPSSPIITEAAAVTRATEAGEADVSGAQWDLDGSGSLSSELVIDGDCSTDSFNDNDDGWSYDAVNEEYDCSGAQGGAVGIIQDGMGLVDGNWYEVSYELVRRSAGEVWLWLGNESGLVTTHQTVAGTYTERLFLSTQVFDRVSIRGDLDFIGSVTNISIKEVSNSLTSLLEEQLGDDLIINGDFAADSDWTKGVGWTINDVVAGKAHCDGTQSGTSQIFQSSSIVIDTLYKVTYTISGYSGSGTIRSSLGGYNQGPVRSGDGTYVEYVSATNPLSNNRVYLAANIDFIGALDDLIVEEVLNDSRGTMVVDMSHPAVSMTDHDLTEDIISLDTSAQEFVSLRGDGAYRMDDSALDCSVFSAYAVGDVNRVIAVWGVDTSNVRYMVLHYRNAAGTLISGSPVAYSGSFNQADHLLFAIGLDYPHEYKNLRFFNRPLTDAEIEAL